MKVYLHLNYFYSFVFFSFFSFSLTFAEQGEIRLLDHSNQVLFNNFVNEYQKVLLVQEQHPLRKPAVKKPPMRTPLRRNRERLLEEKRVKKKWSKPSSNTKNHEFLLKELFPYENSPFGINGIANIRDSDRDLQTNLDFVSDLGVRWIRHFMGWGGFRKYVEPRKGEFNFSKFDKLLEEANKRNINVLAFINPRRRSKNRELSTTFLSDKKGFQNYIKTMVERYDNDNDFAVNENDPSYPPCDYNGDGKINSDEKKKWAKIHQVKYWEIMNEPYAISNLTPKEYMEVLETSYMAIKEICPDCEVLMGGIADGPRIEKMKRFFARLIELGAAQYFDIMNCHIYGSDGTELLNYYKEILNGDKSGDKSFFPCKKGSKIKRIWVTETGYSSRWFGGTEEEQAKELIKRFALGFANGVDKLFLFVLRDVPYDIPIFDTKVFAYHGLLDFPNRRKKPSYLAYKLLVDKLEGFSSVQIINTTDDLYAMEFTRNNRRVYIMWADEPREIALKIKNDQGIVLTKINGEQIKEKNSSVLSLHLDDSPIFIEGGPIEFIK